MLQRSVSQASAFPTAARFDEAGMPEDRIESTLLRLHRWIPTKRDTRANKNHPYLYPTCEYEHQNWLWFLCLGAMERQRTGVPSRTCQHSWTTWHLNSVMDCFPWWQPKSSQIVCDWKHGSFCSTDWLRLARRFFYKLIVKIPPKMD